MESEQTIKELNLRLVNHFGVDTVTGQPMWRVAYSEDQFEHQLGTYDDFTPGGIYLRTVREVRYVPKYSQWIHNKYILERLVAVPEINKDDLPAIKLSYEPIHVFEDINGNYLPPKFEAAKFLVDLVYAAMGRSTLAKYSALKDMDPDATPEKTAENDEKEYKDILEGLYGDESTLRGAIVHGHGVGYTGPSKIQ